MTSQADEAKQEALMEALREHFKVGHLKQAKTLLDEALRIAPRDLPLLMLRATALFRMGSFEAALLDYQAARSIDPEDADTWLGECLCLALGRDIQPAMNLFEEMAERHPNFVRGQIAAARFYFKLVVPVKGHAHLQAALAADPSRDERREIEGIQKDESRLDKKRIYRPDFVTLRAGKSAPAKS